MSARAYVSTNDSPREKSSQIRRFDPAKHSLKKSAKSVVPSRPHQSARKWTKTNPVPARDRVHSVHVLTTGKEGGEGRGGGVIIRGRCSVCVLGWRDLKLLGIFEIGHVQVYFYEFNSEKSANFAARKKSQEPSKFKEKLLANTSLLLQRTFA